MLSLLKLTPNNVFQFIGYQVLFKTRNGYIIKKIIGVSNSGKSIKIDCGELQNNLEIISRNVYVLIE